MTTWATDADVLELTGTTVSAAQVAQAGAVIDVVSGAVSASSSALTARDRRLLKYAVAYQAAWLASQVDVTSRMSVTSATQDGASFSVPDEDALVLAPLARRSLAGLSWRRSVGTLRVGDGRTRYPTWEAYAAAWLRDDSPAADSGWRPL